MEATNKYEQLRQAVGGFKKSNWIEETRKRHSELGWRKKSQLVAMRILRTLREKGMSQTALAEILGVSPQQVNKWVKGSENFTFETVSKIEDALGIQLIEVTKDTPKACLVVAFTKQEVYEDCFNLLVAAEPKMQYAIHSQI